MIRLSLLITLTLLVVLGLPACSGDSGPVSPSPSPSSLGAVVAHTPTATAISTPDSGEYQVDAVEVQLGSGRELATAQFKVTVTRVSGQKDNPAPILMSTNGKEPLEMREISGMVAGDQETYTFTEILSKGSHQVVISVGDSDKSVVLTVPRPPIGTPAVAAIGQPIATATPKLPPILRIAPTKQPLVPKPTLPTPTPTPNFNLLVKPSLPSPTPTVEIIRPVIRTPDKLKLRLALPSPTPTIEIVRPIISTPVPLTLVPRKITPTPLPQPTILLPTPTPQIVPVMAPQPDTSQSLMSKQQYAEFCGELFFSLPTESFQRFIATGGKDEEAKGHFSEWYRLWTLLRPPPELDEFHASKLDQFESQLEQGGYTLATYTAYVREIRAVDAMTAELQGILLKEGCLLFLDVSQGQKLLEAIRVAESRGPAPNPPTVQDYADRCGDIRKTIPIMGGREVIGSHLVNGQEALTPPPELQRVHELIIVIFQEWAKSEPSVSSTQEMNIALGRLSPETLDTLRSSGCLSSQN